MAVRLSVVVPVYNVASYVEECLASLAAQTYVDLDVVVVDDGSTDGSGALASAFADDDPRFRVLSQENRGLGAARNAGAAAAVGDYLAFVDSDDVLPAYAFEVLVGALEQTGSDFASGNVALLADGALRPSPLHRGTHRVTRLGVRLADHRYLVYDRLACNKVFRRTFWEGHGLRFPEGVRYEDIPVTVPAYGLARAVDVVDVPVYYWRQRGSHGERSISQRLAEIANLEDRFAAVSAARRSLSAMDDALSRWYAETALQSDLRLVLEVLPYASPGYHARFLGLASAFLADVPSSVVDRLPRRLARAWRLVRRGALPDLLAHVGSVVEGAVDADASRGGPGMAAWREPARGLAVAGVEWVGDRLTLWTRGAPAPFGVIWLRESPPAAASRGADASGVAPGDGAASGGAASRGPVGSPRAVVMGAQGRGGALSASLDPSRLRSGGQWSPGEWTVNLTPALGLLRGRTTLPVAEPRPVLPGRWVDASTRLVPVERAGVLRIAVDQPAFWATDVRVEAAEVVVTGGGTVPTGARLRMERTPGVGGPSYPLRPASAQPSPLSGSASAGSPRSAGSDTPGGSVASWSARVPVTDLAAGVADRPAYAGEAPVTWRLGIGAAMTEASALVAGPAFDPAPTVHEAVEVLPVRLPDGTVTLRVTRA